MNWKEIDWKALGLRIAAWSEKYGNWVVIPLALLIALFSWWRMGLPGLVAGGAFGFVLVVAVMAANSLKLPLAPKETGSFLCGLALGAYGILLFVAGMILSIVAGCN